MAKTFIFLGLLFLVVGLVWLGLEKLGLRRLPGDILIERENFTLYIPITTAILISLVLSLLLWWLGR